MPLPWENDWGGDQTFGRLALMATAVSISEILSKTGSADLWPAERALLAAVADGTLCKFAETAPDPSDLASPRIRAALLQHLITGGSEVAPVAAAGVRLMGAVIEGPLTLGFMTARGETDLRARHYLETDSR